MVLCYVVLRCGVLFLCCGVSDCGLLFGVGCVCVCCPVEFVMLCLCVSGVCFVLCCAGDCDVALLCVLRSCCGVVCWCWFGMARPA